MRKIAFFLLAVLLLMSCSSNTLYSQYTHLDGSEWPADSALTYSFEVTDTLAHYDMVMNIRHTAQYPYQNVWLFASLYKDSIRISCDTLEYYLADQRGRWLGGGYGNLRTMPMLYRQNIRFAMPGNYHLQVQQGMRSEMLRGVNDFGLTITTYGQK